MQYRRIDNIELFRNRFGVDAKTAKLIEALLDGVVKPITLSVVREVAADTSDVEQILLAVDFLIDGHGVQRIVRGDERVGLWAGRDGETGWAMIRNFPENSWEITSPKSFAERFQAELSPQ
jgi:thiamine monophosphate synthase